MDTKKLDKWASLLFDTGKRNNLINFRTTKASTLEVVLPELEELFQKAESAAAFEVYDPKLTERETEEEGDSDGVSDTDAAGKEKLTRREYIDTYGPKIKKSNQLLLYSAYVNPINALKNIEKKARSYTEETGVNVAYMAFSFILWRENESDAGLYRAPLLLAPITFRNDSAISPWFVKMTEDDIVVNPTFRYKLENEFGVKLPDFSGESLSEYLESVNSMVQKLGFFVSKECQIGIFSFLKINMYQDIKNNTEEILANPNVRMLLGEPTVVQNTPVANGLQKLENPLVELHNVVDADSSQMEAIEMAKAGVSFVLQGPPGTGKSQTITNIIAECIHDGKKVLFVSEKQAALNVVYDKLCKAGLEEFCLELHSYKANKKDVIRELCETLKAVKVGVSDKATKTIDSKQRSQKELDAYEEELHKKRDGINRSIYQLYGAYTACRKAPELSVTIMDIETKGEEYLSDATELLKQYEDFLPSIGENYKENVWYGFIGQDTSYQGKEKLKKSLQEICQYLERFIGFSGKLSSDFGGTCLSFAQSKLWNRFFKLAATGKLLTPSFLCPSSFSELRSRLQEMEPLAKDMKEIKEKIDEDYDAEIYLLEARVIQKKLSRQFSGIFSRLFSSEYRKIIADIRLNHKKGKKPKYKAAVKQMEELSLYQEKQAKFKELEEPILSSLGESYLGEKSDFSSILACVNEISDFFTSGLCFSGLANLSKEAYQLRTRDFQGYQEELTALLTDSEQQFCFLSDCFDKEVISFSDSPFEDLQKKVFNCLSEYDRLENWCSFSVLLNSLREKQLSGYLEETISKGILNNQIVEAFERNFYFQWIDFLWQKNPVLGNFSRISHDRQVENFKKQDETQFSVSKVQIRSKLSAKRPSLDLISSGSAVSVLLREGEKKRKQKSIRTLLEETGELTQLLKPCFLMSPLSVSTFLSSGTIRFDVVVFDEASQIFPQDAIGAIYRGKSLIVVGDSKQMPPSNFFNATMDQNDSDEETGDVTDFESILDLCSTALPQLRLSWHYRSKFEQLIAFSNKNFYQNSLITFPSAATDRAGVGVDFHYVENGVFDHKSRSNRKEAERIVELIFENIDQYPNRSLGVVAFSISQQDLIERLLSKRRQEDPSREAFFRKDIAEPFFIKNLETVQGDERDTIIFSVAYAKDETGRLMHNFGPLNRAGGERRLNVAVTRAKINVLLVASIHCTDIDLQRTGAEGAKLLREYLDYAENGGIALQRAITAGEFEESDSVFEEEVYDFLTENGFAADKQVGCSSFRIDIGLRMPETSDYVLAIECDGATYHSSKNARDRDRLRQSILERMGWKFYRIWSTDWLKNPAVEKERLLKAAQDATKTAGASSFTEDSTVAENAADSAISEESAAVGTSENVTDIFDDEMTESDFEEEIPETHFSFPKYREANLLSLYQSAGNHFLTFVKSVLEIEAPLSEEWFLKRIPWIFNREKVTSVVIQEYESRMVGYNKFGICRKNGFLYRKEASEFVLRIPESKESKREIRHICREELAAGMKVIIGQNITVEKKGLYLSLANALGYQRVADAMLEKFDDALTLLSGQVEEENGYITTKS